jgi:hypothetical protein
VIVLAQVLRLQSGRMAATAYEGKSGNRASGMTPLITSITNSLSREDVRQTRATPFARTGGTKRTSYTEQATPAEPEYIPYSVREIARH